MTELSILSKKIQDNNKHKYVCLECMVCVYVQVPNFIYANRGNSLHGPCLFLRNS